VRVSPQHELSTAFMTACGRDDEIDRVQLEATLSAALGEAQQAWPQLTVDAIGFARHLGERVADDDLLGALARLRTSDLYLVCAVLQGDARAHRVFDQHLVDRLVPALSNLAVDSDVVQEAQQRVRELLLLPRPDAPPRLATYDGRGSLWSWARVVGIREAITIAKRRRPAALPDDDGAIVDVLAQDPELRFLKDTYRAAFGRAFAAALQDLESKPRTALRLHHVDRLTLDKTAELLGVHRATAARWLARARNHLLETTRRHMMDDLDLDSEQLDSIIDLIASRFDVSVARLLQ
jgi:RNA polymerase sigma-70 factor, ECF subfamily